MNRNDVPEATADTLASRRNEMGEHFPEELAPLLTNNPPRELRRIIIQLLLSGDYNDDQGEVLLRLLNLRGAGFKRIERIADMRNESPEQTIQIRDAAFRHIAHFMEHNSELLRWVLNPHAIGAASGGSAAA